LKSNRLLAGTLVLVLILGISTTLAFAQSTEDEDQNSADFAPSNELVSPSGGSQVIGVTSGWSAATPVMTADGHTVINPVNLNNPLTVDVLLINRGEAGISGTQLTNVQNFLANGGVVVTEFSAAAMWFNGNLASLSGTLTNGFFFACNGCLVTVVDATSPLSIGLPATWISANPIAFFQVYSGLDPSIKVAAEVQGTSEGDLPVVGCADVGGGTAVIFFSDFQDFAGATVEEQQLLLNAIHISACEEDEIVGGEFLPIDNTALMLAGLQSSAIWMIPTLAGLAGVGFYLVKFRTTKE